MEERVRTHWEGCYLYHEECAERKSIDFLQRVLLAAKFELEKYRRHLSAQKKEIEFLEMIIKKKQNNGGTCNGY